MHGPSAVSFCDFCEAEHDSGKHLWLGMAAHCTADRKWIKEDRKGPDSSNKLPLLPLDLLLPSRIYPLSFQDLPKQRRRWGHCWDKILDRCNFRKEGFIWAHSWRAIVRHGEGVEAVVWGSLWWSVLIANLTESRITYKTSLQGRPVRDYPGWDGLLTSPCGVTLIILVELGRPTQLQGTISLGCINREGKVKHGHPSSLSSSWFVDVMWPAASRSCLLGFPSTMNHFWNGEPKEAFFTLSGLC